MKHHPKALLSFAPKIAILGCSVTLLLSGCTMNKPVPPMKETSSFELLPPPDDQDKTPTITPHVQGEASTGARIYTVHISPLLTRNPPPPPYPPAALAARAGRYEIYVTLTIDADGHTSNIQRSWRHPAFPHPQANDFYDSVVKAVSTWQWRAAHDVYWRKVPGQDDQYLRTEPVAETIEMKFVFEPKEARE